MDNTVDLLTQAIQSRVHELHEKMYGETKKACQREKEDRMEQVIRIMDRLPEKDRQLLDSELVDSLAIPEEERIRFYKAGLADAFCMLQYLRM